MYVPAGAHRMTPRRPGIDKSDNLPNGIIHSPTKSPSFTALSSPADVSSPISAPSIPSNSTSPSHSRAHSTSPIAQTVGSISPSIRHPLERPPSPDLPTKDALYLFVNFASYMQSPGEGGEGIVSNEDFKDTIRLLDYARSLRTQPYSNIHLLHLKYRFQGHQRDFRSPYSTGDYVLPLNYRDSTGRLRNPVPQPFSTLHDPVVKVDYRSDGVFNPLPAQAVFAHVAASCQPPPRIIVVSYVSSKATENHIAAISQWALTSSPPCYVFSPLETRLREQRCLHRALHHAIPMSMYAWPTDAPLGAHLPMTSTISLASLPSPYPGTVGTASPVRPEKSTTPVTSPSFGALGMPFKEDPSNLRIDSFGWDGPDSPVDAARRRSSEISRSPLSPLLARTSSRSSMTQKNKDDPVASLTVISGEDNESTVSMSGSPSSSTHVMGSVPAPTDRIPLWTLAPGVGILHGSTSASIGVRLGDFSAINLVATGDSSVSVDPLPADPLSRDTLNDGARPSANGASIIAASDAGIKMASIDMTHLRPLGPPVESPDRPHTPSKVLQPARAANPMTAKTTAKPQINARPIGKDTKSTATPVTATAPPRSIRASPARQVPPIPSTIHLTPPDRPPMINHLSPPELQPGHLTPPKRPAPKLLTNPVPKYRRDSSPMPRAEVQSKAAKSPDSPTSSKLHRTESMQSWPSPVNKVSGWKKGRKEQMEDTLEALKLVNELAPEDDTGLLQEMGGLMLSSPGEWQSGTGPGGGVIRPVDARLPSKSSLAPLLESDEGGEHWIMGLMTMM